MCDSALIFDKLGYWVPVIADYTRFGGKRLLIKQLKIDLASKALSCNLTASSSLVTSEHCSGLQEEMKVL